MIDLEDRLRRTFDAVAEAPLPSPPIVSPRRRWPMPAAAAAAVVLVTGAVVVATRPDPETLAVTGEPKGLMAFEISEAEQQLLTQANRRLLRDCMVGVGQPFVDGWPGDVGRLDRHWTVLGRTDLRRAEQLGYAIPPDSHGSIPPAVGTIEDQAAWSGALVGDDQASEVRDPVTGRVVGSITTGGCQGEADRDMFGDVVRWQSLSRFVFALRGQLDEAVLADERVVAGLDAWAGCMADRGRPYPRPTTPRARFDALPSTPPSAEEVATAVDDVACKRSTGLIATYEAVQAERGRAVAARYGALLAEHRAIVDRALDRAGEILEPADETTTTSTTPTDRPPTPRFEGRAAPLDATVELVERDGGVQALQVRLHSAPSLPARWLQVLVDGKVTAASSAVTGGTFGINVSDLDGAHDVQVVATDDTGLVVADHGFRTFDFDD